MKEVERICGNCARFKVPDSGCTYAKDIREGTITADDPACGDDFYPNPIAGKRKREPAPIRKVSGIAQEGPFEAIYHNDKLGFLVKTEKDFEVLESVKNAGQLVLPKEFKEIPYSHYGFYEGEVPSREDLFWKVRDEFDLFLDVDSVFKDLLADCVLLSYQQEKLRNVPYLYFYGDNESGKTVALTILSLLCYRPMFGVTIPSADLYGYLDDSDCPGVILEDEVQGLHKDLDKSKVYKAGYKAGASIPRTFILERSRFIKYFRCFCFKACAAEEMPRVKGLTERFLFIQMVEGFPRRDWADFGGEDLERIRQLRNMLLKWRLASWEWELPEVELSCRGRLRELWKPILQIVSGLTVEPTLKGYVEHLEKERMDEKQSSFEGHLIKVVSELYEKDKPIPFVDIWDGLVVDLQGKLDDKKPHRMDTPEFGDVTKQRVGHRLREVVGGSKRVIRLGRELVKAYEFHDDKMRRIAKKYGFNIVTKLPMLPTLGGVSASETMEKSMENNVEKTVDTPQKLGNIGNIGNTVTTIDDLRSVYWSDELWEKGERACGVCGYLRQSTWEAETVRGEKIPVCDDCAREFQKRREAS